MKLLAQAQAILAKEPLPDDAPQQLDALIEQASGQERQFIMMSTDALYAAATPEQLVQWNTEPENQ